MHRRALLHGTAAALLSARARAATVWKLATGYRAVDELRRHGIKVEPPPAALGTHLRRLGERFALEWIREVGPQANAIFIPYYSTSTS